MDTILSFGIFIIILLSYVNLHKHSGLYASLIQCLDPLMGKMVRSQTPKFLGSAEAWLARLLYTACSSHKNARSTETGTQIPLLFTRYNCEPVSSFCIIVFSLSLCLDTQLLARTRSVIYVLYMDTPVSELYMLTMQATCFLRPLLEFHPSTVYYR